MIVISVCALVSYWFSHIGSVLRFPSVVFLLATGLGMRELTDSYDATVVPGPGLLPLLGTVGLILGLMLNNPHLIRRVKWLKGLHRNHYLAELVKLKHLTAEATFLVRTFFFLLLGCGTDLNSLADAYTWAVALALVAAVFLLRLPLLWVLGRGRTLPPLWAAPRGLITVRLFYSLPAATVPEVFPPGALILVVLLSGVSMALGLRLAGGTPAEDAADSTIERRLDAEAAPPA